MALLSFDQRDFLRTRAFLQRYDLKRGATPELLGVAARTEYALGNHEGAVEFARRVVQEFPASKEADLFANRSEEHTSELQSLMRISYAVFCLKKKINKIQTI